MTVAQSQKRIGTAGLIFMGLSLVLLVSDLLFVWINYVSLHTSFDHSMREQAEQQRAAYALAAEIEFGSMLKMATMLAQSPHIQQLFLRGKRAVEAEGGGAGGPQAAQVRAELLAATAPLWARLHDDFGVRQLHFHLAPGALTFLRVHKPEKFGDRLDTVRYSIVDANTDLLPRSGFEIGRTYSGMRGVMPMFAQDPASGERIHIGAVEVGSALDHMLQAIDTPLDSGVAALLYNRHVERNMWPEMITEVFEQVLDICGCSLEATTRDEVVELIRQHKGFPPFSEDQTMQLSVVEVAGREYAVTHLPLYDYLAQREANRKPVGRILMWRDVSAERATFEQGVESSIVYGVLGFLLVELILFWAVRLTTGKMQQVIDAQTRTLRNNAIRLEHAASAAQSASRSKSAFLANMSHELRTPLNAMLGFAQVLQRDEGLSPARRQAVDTIKRSGDYLLTLINDVLDLAKVEAGRLDLLTGPCDLRALFDSLVELFSVHAREKGIEFIYVQGGQLPHWVEGDEKRLRQIVMNLLGNAFKFTERGSVSLEAEMTEEGLEIHVKDSGIGISQDKFDGLFQPFVQEGSSEYRNQGTGLGLAICMSLVKEMGGRIEVESSPGEGSCFSVFLPLAVLDTQTRVDESESGESVIGYRRTDGGEAAFTLLVVDDVVDNRNVIRGLLEPLGFHVTEAVDGCDAIERARNEHPDLILMDLLMPKCDGFEASRRILDSEGLQQMPIIALSASVLEEDLYRCQVVGCREYLIKPIQLRALLAVLARQLPLAWERNRAQVESAVVINLDHNQRARLRELLQHGNLKEIRRMLNEFPTSVDGEVAELRRAALRFDMKQIREVLDGAAE